MPAVDPVVRADARARTPRMTGGIVIGLIAAVKVVFVLVVLGAGGAVAVGAAAATALAVGGLAARHR